MLNEEIPKHVQIPQYYRGYQNAIFRGSRTVWWWIRTKSGATTEWELCQAQFTRVDILAAIGMNFRNVRQIFTLIKVDFIRIFTFYKTGLVRGCKLIIIILILLLITLGLSHNNIWLVDFNLVAYFIRFKCASHARALVSPRSNWSAGLRQGQPRAYLGRPPTPRRQCNSVWRPALR